jgi:hypothetical protein
VVVVFFALTQRWRALVAAVAVYLLFAFEVVRRLGFKAYPEFFESTIGHADRWVNNIRNASISGIVQRLFYPAHTYPYGHALSNTGQVLAALASAALVLLAWFVIWPAMRAGRSNPSAVDIPFAIMTIVSMAPGPYQWEHYNVTLLLPCFVLLATALHARRPDGHRSWRTMSGVGVILAAVWAMLDMNFWTRHDLPAQAQQNPALRNKMYWYEVTAWLPWVVLLIALLVLCWRRYPPTRLWSRQPRPA